MAPKKVAKKKPKTPPHIVVKSAPTKKTTAVKKKSIKAAIGFLAQAKRKAAGNKKLVLTGGAAIENKFPEDLEFCTFVFSATTDLDDAYTEVSFNNFRQTIPNGKDRNKLNQLGRELDQCIQDDNQEFLSSVVSLIQARLPGGDHEFYRVNFVLDINLSRKGEVLGLFMTDVTLEGSLHLSDFNSVPNRELQLNLRDIKSVKNVTQAVDLFAIRI